MKDESLNLTFQISDIEENRDSVESLNMARIEESRISPQLDINLSDDEDDVALQRQSNFSASYELSYDTKIVKLTKSQKHNRKMKRKRQREASLDPKPIMNLPRSEEYEGMSKTKKKNYKNWKKRQHLKQLRTEFDYAVMDTKTL